MRTSYFINWHFRGQNDLKEGQIFKSFTNIKDRFFYLLSFEPTFKSVACHLLCESWFKFFLAEFIDHFWRWTIAGSAGRVVSVTGGSSKISGSRPGLPASPLTLQVNAKLQQTEKANCRLKKAPISSKVSLIFEKKGHPVQKHLELQAKNT